MKRSGWVVGWVLGSFLVGAAGAPAEQSTGGMSELVRAYEPIQLALAADSTASVVEAAARVAERAEALGPKDSERPEYSGLIAAARGVKASDIKTLREQVKPLSLALAKLVQSQPVEGYGIYFCPMADAYWLQKVGAVRNPYYGKSMLTCGELVKKVEG